MAPAAAAWPPPPSRAQVRVALRLSSVRRETLVRSGASSRRVAEIRTPWICPAKAAMSSASASPARASSIMARDSPAMAMAPPSWNSMEESSRLSSRSRGSDLVRKHRLFTFR